MKNAKKLLAVLLSLLFIVFAMGSGDDTTTEADQGTGTVETDDAADNADSDIPVDDTELGDYSIEISECRLAKDFEGKDVIVVKYKFTNNSSDESQAFAYVFEDTAYQDGIGLNEAYILDDSANYDEGNQTKEIKKGSSLDVEVAYELNDTTTDVEIEVSELFSFEEKVITKTFSIAE